MRNEIEAKDVYQNEKAWEQEQYISVSGFGIAHARTGGGGRGGASTNSVVLC